MDVRTISVAFDPNMMNTILDHVSCGGSVIDLCKTWRINYAQIMRKIKENPDYKKRYEEALVEREEWAKERLLKELHDLTSFSIKDAINEDGTFKRLGEMPDSIASSIKKLTKDGQIEFVDKLKALDLLGKRLGIFVEKREVTGTLTLEQLILNAQKLEKDVE